MDSLSSPSSSAFFLAIDGGGSTTRALIGNPSGEAWGYGTAAGSNPHERGIEASVQELKAATDAAWSNLGEAPRPFAGAFLGVAGAGALSPEQRHELGAWISLSGEARVEVDHDVRIALAGALGGRPGIAIVTGTGSSGYGRNATGETARAGGWGPLIDDVGGAYWFGLRILSLVARSHDGRSPRSPLNAAVLRAIGCQSEPQLLGWLREPQVGRPQIAALAQLLFTPEIAKHEVAGSLIAEGARELCLISAAIGARLFPGEDTEVVMTGGLSQSSEYTKAFTEALAAIAPKYRVVAAEHSPLVGALLLAATNAGAAVKKGWGALAEQAVARSEGDTLSSSSESRR